MITPDRFQLVKRIFLDICASEPSVRLALLESRCGEDTELRTEIESLLAEDESVGGFLETPVLGPVNMWSAIEDERQGRPSPTPQPDRIGHYRILDVLGEGGMGVVYLAAQDNPQRQVALKVIRPGLMSGSMLRRFEYEAHALATLGHPGIAQIFEMGSADSGFGSQPYLAMELVRGQPLLEYTSSNRLTVAQKLEILARIGDAVHHAHQKGVIHRDLKPANILVTSAPASSDAESIAQPKILDFGVACAVDSDGLATSLRTQTGQLVGTVRYMSPEQIRSGTRDLDTRSDVYSLGVVAYEMLAGRHPHNVEAVSLAEAARIIGDEPARPLSSADPTLRGDVSTIIHKALEKDRTRRYQSASDLAEDLRRVIANRPIQARPPSRLHLVRLFVRRHRAAVIAASVACVFFVAGVTSLVWMQRASSAIESDSREARVRTAALQQHGFELREGDDPFIARETDLALLDDHVRFVDEHLGDQPIEAARVLDLIGLNYWRLGRYDEALIHVEKALSLRQAHLVSPHEELAESLHNRGRVLWHLQRTPEAEQSYREALAIRVALYGEVHLDSATSMTHLAAALRKQGRLDEAEPLYRKTLAIRQQLLVPDHEDIAASHNNLAMCLRDLGRNAEACEMFGQALAMVRNRVQPDDIRIAKAMQNVAACKIDLHDFEAADEWLTQSLQIKTRKLPPGHPDIAAALYQQARLRFMSGEPSSAERLCRQALEMQQASLSHSVDAADTMTLLGIVLTQNGDAAEAEEWIQAGLDIRTGALASGHAHIGESLSALGASLMAQGRWEEAGPLLREGFELLRHRRADDPQLQAATDRLAAFEQHVKSR